MFLRVAAVVAALTFSFLATGCSGSSKPRITGKVTLDGTPLADAEVSFEKQQKGPGAKYKATTDAEGKYHLVIYGTQPVEAGTYRVTIAKYVDKKGKVTDPGELTQLKMAGMAKNIVPSQYSDPAFSQLKADLKPQDMEIPPFELKSKGK